MVKNMEVYMTIVSLQAYRLRTKITHCASIQEKIRSNTDSLEACAALLHSSMLEEFKLTLLLEHEPLLISRILEDTVKYRQLLDKFLSEKILEFEYEMLLLHLKVTDVS